MGRAYLLRVIGLFIAIIISLTACKPPSTMPVALASPANGSSTTVDEGTESVAATDVAYAAFIATEDAAPTLPPLTPTPTPPLIPTPIPGPPPTYTYRVINTYPHDPTAFTQGLVHDDGVFLESTGLYGQSDVREVAIETGEVLRSRPLDPQYFGEGLTLLNDRVYQLTWQENTGFIYDRDSFDLLQTFDYPTEGWGITSDGQRLIVSDGTATLYFRDPTTLQEIGRLAVHDDNGPLDMLNELEYINGEIWANIWLTDLIARISPETGAVLGYVDLTGLLDMGALSQPVDVLNGIAFDPQAGRLFVTGKFWPTMFEIEVIPTP